MFGVSSDRTVGALARSKPQTEFPNLTVITLAGSSLSAVLHTWEASAAEMAVHMTAQCNLLVFGIGALKRDSVLRQPPHLYCTERGHNIAAGASAVALGRFIDRAEHKAAGPLSGSAMAISPDAAQFTPIRLGVCSGATKCDAVRSAAAAGLLIIVVVTASRTGTFLN